MAHGGVPCRAELLLWIKDPDRNNPSGSCRAKGNVKHMRMQLRGKRRHKLAMGASIAGAAVFCLASATAAGAASAPPVNGTVNLNAPTANSEIVGSGSASTYDMMQSLDTLFNNTPGCVLATGSFANAQGSANQQLNYSCVTDTSSNVLEQVPASAGAAGGEFAYLDNPVNDVAFSEPPIGSSNGIAQLEQSRNNGSTGDKIGINNTTENVSAVNYARSSRAPSGANDISGLNFVAYATDGVSWIHWTKTTAATPSAKVASLSLAQLQGIYNGTIYNWLQVGGKAAPIKVYSAQEGSGTQSTFKTALGFDPSASTNLVNCTGEPAETGKGATAAFPPGGSGVAATTGCTGPINIFENELTSVAAADQPDAIFFYSLGKYAAQCEGVKSKIEQFDKSEIPGDPGGLNNKVNTGCGGSVSVGDPGGVAAKIILGQVNTISPDPQTVLNGTFPIVRDLYNVYSNGSNTNIPAATPATLNYVSEVGFICKPQTIDGTPGGTKIDDPATGAWYQTEIANSILENGFIPIDSTATTPLYSGLVLPAQAATNEVSGTVGHGAYALLSTESGGTTYTNVNLPGQTSGGNTSIPTSASPDGFCVVSSTDANTNS
jgi:ABC-type phosphate transport system substrate-binding protein